LITTEVLRRRSTIARLETIKKTGLLFGLSFGLSALLIAVWGWRLVGDAVASIGFGIIAIIFVRTTTIAVAGLGWQILFPCNLRPPFWRCVLLRFVRDGGNNMLVRVGGDVVGARLLSFSGVSGPLAVASVIVDVLLQAVTQFAFAICGLTILLALGGPDSVAWAALPGLLIATVALGGFYWAQRHGGRRLISLILDRFASEGDGLRGRVDEVYQRLASIHASRSTLVGGLVHFAGWLIGSAEAYMALAFMGRPVGVAEAVVIESLFHAVRGAAFAVPGALGAQEAGLILVCAVRHPVRPSLGAVAR